MLIVVADVNECDDPVLNTCSQVCINLQGSFQCACNPGYELNADNITCDGEIFVF